MTYSHISAYYFSGVMQRIFYRGDRHCHFLNWLVIIDALGYVVLSRLGFLGRTNDANCMKWVTVSNISYGLCQFGNCLSLIQNVFSHIHLPVLPHGLQIMADQGFAHNPPVIVLPRANQPQLTRRMWRYINNIFTMLRYWLFAQILHKNLFFSSQICVISIFICNIFHPSWSRTFRSRRNMIERCFGILKNSYSSVGTKRFRSCRWNGPIICNLTAALYNRCKILFQRLRQQLRVRFMPLWWQFHLVLVFLIFKDVKFSLDILGYLKIFLFMFLVLFWLNF